MNLFKRRRIEYVEVDTYKYDKYEIPILGGTVKFTVKSCRLWEWGFNITIVAYLDTTDSQTRNAWTDILVDNKFKQSRNKRYFELSQGIPLLDDLFKRLSET
ncbi:hypothetical protein [Enterococcus sp. BWR-S5]|uniref:hypothetical protein n=1 Tax=Enterococcus sp. BWR-S5 TaxID=2787714 RepID=UPI001920EBB5|nr:hypothetical protein [Enterococcus sp. BWR-S5]MBL1225388.1 hypothetical protein [Enterococcus sp. BWR-S5]